MKINLLATIVFFCLISCNNKAEENYEKEKSLLEKELELTKRELEIEKKKKSEETTFIETKTVRNSIPKFNFEKPEQILEAIIYAAKNKNYDVLYNLCDPQEKGDIESLCLCSLSSKYKSDYVESQNCTNMTNQDFINLFRHAENPKTISNDGMYATVEYQVKNLDVKMEMVKRKNRWYIFTLSSPEPGE